MDRAPDLDRLPSVYRELLLLLEDDRSPAEIGAALGVEETSLPALELVARAKLERLAETANNGGV